MKRILVIDHWYKVSSGASKATLYGELSKYFELIFIKVGLPWWFGVRTYVRTFHPNIKKWKQRKARFEETVQKRPETFRLLTQLYSKRVKRVHKPYDAVLQIGSLFGPVENLKGVPYFSYSDSTVRNPDLMWPDWMPDDFDKFRDDWYTLEKNYFQTLTGSMFYSHWAADTMVKEYAVPSDRAHVVGSALKMPGDYKVDWDKRKKQVIFISTDFKRKGGYELPKIFSQVIQAIPDARLIVVGNVPEDFDFRASWLELKGALSKSELMDVYKESSILLHPAKYDPFPSVILEAANFEIPAVASLICGIPEMIKDTDTGYTVDPCSHNLFADCLVDLLKNTDHCKEMGKAAKAYVRNKFYPSSVAKNIKRVLDCSHNGRLINILHVTSLGSLSVLGSVPAEKNLGGGVGNNLLACIDYASRNGLYDSYVTCPMETAFSQKAKEKGHNVVIIKTRWIKIFGRPITTLMDIFKIISLIRDYHIDVIHAYDFAAGFNAGLASKIMRVPMVVSVHQEKTDYLASSTNIFKGLLSRIRRYLVFWTWNRSASMAVKIIPVADFIGKTVKENMKVDPSKLQTVFNGIDIGKFSEIEPDRNLLRNEFNIGEDDILIGSIGRIEKRKGFEYFVEAAKTLVRMDKRFKFIILGGEGDSENIIRKRIKDYGLLDRFYLAGPRNDIQKIIAAFDIFVLPSLMEGMPTVVMEAMYAKVPVIATSVSGTPEIVIDRETGMLIGAGKPTEIVKAVIEMVDDMLFRKRIVEKAYKKVTSEFALKQKAENLFNIYHRVIDGYKG